MEHVEERVDNSLRSDYSASVIPRRMTFAFVRGLIAVQPEENAQSAIGLWFYFLFVFAREFVNAVILDRRQVIIPHSKV